MELDDFRLILGRCAAAHWSLSEARIYLATSNEDVPLALRELLDPWVITQAQARAAEGWEHMVFAIFEPPGPSTDADCEWTLLAPEKVAKCASEDDARRLSDKALDRLAKQRQMR
jgi:hypothetical protein